MRPIDYSKYEGHTPGPWWSDETMYVFADNNDPRMVLEIRGWGWLQYKGEYAAESEFQANGRLAAAAPDLLAACRERDEEIERLRELLRRAREIVNIAQLYMESGNEAPEEDWFMVDGWIRDYESQIADTSSRVSTDRDEGDT